MVYLPANKTAFSFVSRIKNKNGLSIFITFGAAKLAEKLTISIADAAVGLDLIFGGNTTTNKISLTDNLADALNVTESSNSYMKFVLILNDFFAIQYHYKF